MCTMYNTTYNLLICSSVACGLPGERRWSTLLSSGWRLASQRAPAAQLLVRPNGRYQPAALLALRARDHRRRLRAAARRQLLGPLSAHAAAARALHASDASHACCRRSRTHMRCSHSTFLTFCFTCYAHLITDSYFTLYCTQKVKFTCACLSLQLQANIPNPNATSSATANPPSPSKPIPASEQSSTARPEKAASESGSAATTAVTKPNLMVLNLVNTKVLRHKVCDICIRVEWIH